MNIMIAGGTGFVGQSLVAHYKDNHNVIVIGRNQKKIHSLFNSAVQALSWESFKQDSQQYVKNADLIINLAGSSIGEKRWTRERKADLLKSRITTTKMLAKACAKLGSASPPLFNASAVGVYGLQKTEHQGLPPAYTEESHIDFNYYPDFLAEIARKWEAETAVAKRAQVRVVNMRFGVVLAKHGGVLPQLLMPYKFFLGGKIGSGQQPFSWISLVDLIRAIDFLQDHTDISGPVNLVAPQAVSQAELAETIGKIINRPSFLRTPSFVLRLLFGEMAEELLLNGQHVKPGVLLANGFQFTYPDIDKALTSIFHE